MSPERWFCLFRGDAGPMAVPAESVAEVVDDDRVVRLAWSPPQVVGLCPYRRDVIPVVRLAPERCSVAGDAPVDTGRAIGHGPSGDEQDAGRDGRGILLILKAERGAWGIRSDSAGTIMSRGCPEGHPPRADGDGPVLVGTISHEGTPYGVIDSEATWTRLRAGIVRWHGLIGGLDLPAAIATAEGPQELPEASREWPGGPEADRGGE